MPAAFSYARRGSPKGVPSTFACCSCANAASLGHGGGQGEPVRSVGADLELRGSWGRLGIAVVREATRATAAGIKRIAGRHGSRGASVACEVEAVDLVPDAVNLGNYSLGSCLVALTDLCTDI